MIGRNTCTSNPVDILGIQLVELTICRFWENAGVCVCPPAQFRAISSAGQPNTVLLMSASCPGLMRSCEPRTMGFIPISTKGAKATGPAMVIRYSRFVTRLASPPGNTIRSTGTGMV